MFSIDLSHYFPYERAVELDSYCINFVYLMDYRGVSGCTTDGNQVLLTLLSLAEKINLTPETLLYGNSGDVTGERGSVVGYAAMAFYEERKLSKEEGRTLVELARDTINLYVREKKVFEPGIKEITDYPPLSSSKAAFVSLTKNGQLRGSIGHLLPIEPLYLSVRDNAVSASSRDFRFKPVEKEELDDIKITVSVLGAPKLLQAKNPEEILSKLVPLESGVILEKSGRRATYLPQVWRELPDKEEFLTNLCMKASLPPNCWTDNSTKIYVYGAQVFYE